MTIKERKKSGTDENNVTRSRWRRVATGRSAGKEEEKMTRERGKRKRKKKRERKVGSPRGTKEKSKLILCEPTQAFEFGKIRCLD